MASLEAEKTELKEEGVIETATELQQDPQSKVNPDTVEEKLVDETREAGGAAYQFDPDASPEDKAAAAEAVRPIAHHSFPSDVMGKRIGANSVRSVYHPVSTTTKSPRAYP